MTGSRRRVSSGSLFEKQAGYSRAVVQEPWCFVSGTTGYDYQTMEMPGDIETQTANCLATIDAALAEAGFGRSEIIRANYIVTDPGDAERVFPILGEYFEDVRPAATMIVASLIRPEMRIEIEVTALRR